MTHRHLKTVAVANEAVFCGAIVISEYLFVQVAEKMKRFDVDVRAFQAALEQAPEILQPVRVHLPIYVAFGMVDRLVREMLWQILVGHECVRIECGAGSDVPINFSVQRVLLAIRNYVGANLTATFQHSNDSRFALHAAVKDFQLALVSVHESSSTTDKGFVHFDFLATPADLHEVFVMQGEANAVHHKPSRLLRDAQRPTDLIGTNTVLRVHNQPNGNHPLVHAQRGILKDSPDLDRELLLASLAKPDAARRDERVLDRIAAWARHVAIRPAQGNRIVKGLLRVREISNCFLQRFGKLEVLVHG